MTFIFSVQRRATHAEAARIDKVLAEYERRLNAATTEADFAAAETYRRRALRRAIGADVYCEDPRGSYYAQCGLPYLIGQYLKD